MKNATEADERAYLEEIEQKLREAFERVDVRLRRYAADVQAQKTYLWENRADMDHVEKISSRQSAQQSLAAGEAVQAEQVRLLKLMQSPYFGRFDFTRDDGVSRPLPVYVGVHTFVDESEGNNLIFDWRAPISAMFYDFEPGPAQYRSPSGNIAGEIQMKRQFRIRDGRMIFMLESGLNILDDVLQEELSRASDDRMKTIVATIQRDQNAVIRNEDAPVLIIQGAAGSGKTSIALHRIAFLLYRFKETLTAKDILILSPNKVFADFISNVLPELGEEQIAEIDMEALARELLDDKIRIQTFFEQTSLLLEKKDTALEERIREKASLAFLKKLDDYAAYVECNRIAATDLTINGRLVPDWLIEESFNKRPGRPVNERIRWAAEVIEHDVLVEYRYQISAKERAALKTALKKMVDNSSLRSLYKAFFTWIGSPHLLKPARNAALEWSDVFPLIYLKLRLEGTAALFENVRHLVVDEMQDYSPVQYAVISRLFSCDMTILGDVNQSINPFSASSSATILGVFTQAECVTLTKSYRSSFEITMFAQGVLENRDLIAIERHGEPPQVLRCKNKQEEQRRLVDSIRAFVDRGYRTIGVICKTQQQAEHWYQAIRELVTDIHLLTSASTCFVQGVVFCAAFSAKGLEFDCVLIPEVTNKNYTDEMDRHQLYVACTRAMHRLTLTHAGPRTELLSFTSTE